MANESAVGEIEQCLKRTKKIKDDIDKERDEMTAARDDAQRIVGRVDQAFQEIHSSLLEARDIINYLHETHQIIAAVLSDIMKYSRCCADTFHAIEIEDARFRREKSSSWELPAAISWEALQQLFDESDERIACNLKQAPFPRVVFQPERWQECIAEVVICDDKLREREEMLVSIQAEQDSSTETAKDSTETQNQPAILPISRQDSEHA